MKSFFAAGNVKMRGKKHKLLHCGCCVASDFRDGETEKYAKQQINEYYMEDRGDGHQAVLKTAPLSNG